MSFLPLPPASWTQNNYLKFICSSMYVSILHFFSLLSSISLYGYLDHSLFFSTMDVHEDCFLFVAITNKAALNIHAWTFLWA